MFIIYSVWRSLLFIRYEDSHPTNKLYNIQPNILANPNPTNLTRKEDTIFIY